MNGGFRFANPTYGPERYYAREWDLRGLHRLVDVLNYRTER